MVSRPYRYVNLTGVRRIWYASGLGDLDLIHEKLYPHWREAMLRMCDQLPNRTCPFCEEVYEDNAEYVDVGVGGYGVQVTPNVCEECGAQQQGAYDYDSKDFEFASGWVRPKYKMPNGQPDWKNGGTPEDFFDIIEEQIDVEPGTLKTVLSDLYKEATKKCT